MLIHLNGMPGVGKLTVAQILSDRLPAHLVDNHSLINATYTTGFRHGSEGYIRTLLKIMTLVYDELASNTDVKNIIMTNALADEHGPDPDRFAAIEQLAAQRCEPFVPVLLICTEQENRRRIAVTARKEKQKLTDPDVITPYYQRYTLIDPANHPNRLLIDTTSLEPHQTADIICRHIDKLFTPSPSHPPAP